MRKNGKPAGAMVPLTGMYENTSQRSGKKYFTGYLGRAKLVMLQEDRAAEGQPGWTLFIAERPAGGVQHDRQGK